MRTIFSLATGVKRMGFDGVTAPRIHLTHVSELGIQSKIEWNECYGQNHILKLVLGIFSNQLVAQVFTAAVSSEIQLSA